MDFFRDLTSRFTGGHSEPAPTYTSPQKHTTIFGGTGRTGEESVGSSAPPINTRVDQTEHRAVYGGPGNKTVVIPGPGVHGYFVRRIYEKITGMGKTGMDANVHTALQESSSSPPTTVQHVVGYSRGAVSGGRFAQKRAEQGLRTEVDLRDPVEGGGSSITPVSPLVHGRQQVSLGNILPGFGTTLLFGDNISTVVTEDHLGGHAAFARENFGKPLPSGTPGKVTIWNGIQARLATHEDAKRFMEDVDESRRSKIWDEDSAMFYQFKLDPFTTYESRRISVAQMIKKSLTEL